MNWKIEVETIRLNTLQGAVQVHENGRASWAVYRDAQQCHIGDKKLRGECDTPTQAKKECEDAMHAASDIGDNSGGFDVEF
jgi:hypothetical protein